MVSRHLGSHWAQPGLLECRPALLSRLAGLVVRHQLCSSRSQLHHVHGLLDQEAGRGSQGEDGSNRQRSRQAEACGAGPSGADQQPSWMQSTVSMTSASAEELPSASALGSGAAQHPGATARLHPSPAGLTCRQREAGQGGWQRHGAPLVLRPGQAVQRQVQHLAADAAEAHEEAVAVVGAHHPAAAGGVLRENWRCTAVANRWR